MLVKMECGGFVRVLVAMVMLPGLISSSYDLVDRSTLPPPCDSLIYCHGPLLNTVQMAGLYKDSKTFVDMKLKVSPNETMHNFNVMMERTNNMPTKLDIQQFVNENFDPADTEFEDWTAPDWKPHPAFLSRIKDPVLMEWASSINHIWLELGRKMKDEVRLNQQLYSIIYVDHPVIVPGGRFREFYYWDSYWIIRGLLLSEMHKTAQGMITNFLDIVDKFGHIPNGGRIYYLERSQPPMLIPMVKSYMDDMGDIDYLKEKIHILDKEFNYWMEKHMVEVEQEGRKFKLAKYGDFSQGPRPESYREDIESAAIFDTTEKKEEHYAELKAAAESGWDFSSRWFITNGTNKGNLTHLKTRSIIPVDLNAIMCWNAQLMAEFHGQLGNYKQQAYYKDIHAKFMEAIDKVLWHDEVGAWLDYSLDNDRRRDYFYPTNIAPLWTNCYDMSRKENYVPRVINYLDKAKVDNYEAGIPTTFEHSGEQWDYPNAWPPLQYMMVVGLANSGMPSAKRLAVEWATKWVRSNLRVWKDNQAMLEKYDATRVGSLGGGGEYDVQKGFGWTNGIILELLNIYGDTISAEDAFETATTTTGHDNLSFGLPTVLPHAGISAANVVEAGIGAGGVMTALLVVAASISAGALGVVVYRHRRGQSLTHETVRLLRHRDAFARPYTELKTIPERNGAVQVR